VSPRATDWSLAILVALLFGSGLLTLDAGSRGEAWVFVVHGTAGGALALVLLWKARRVWRRVADPRRWDRRTGLGAAATLLVFAALVTGWVWSSAGRVSFAGFTLLAWHEALGFALAALVLVHALARAKPLRRGDVLAGRRQFLAATGVTVAAVAAWQLQRPFARLAGWRGADRRFTGSYEAGSFTGNDFPVTSWVADDPREIDAGGYRLRVEGRTARDLDVPVSDLDAGDELTATLDCTGGFHSTQRWRGVRLDRLLERAGPDDAASHVRIVSVTGYRWSFPLERAPELLLATHVGDEPLSHGHGAPARLVAPGRRGFQWVKWVERIEVQDGPDHGAAASTVWSSFTPEGRGAA
jgi:DMSO/TMAO reductase YedYZ molybdopterin-dependent catalytic subunit